MKSLLKLPELSKRLVLRAVSCHNSDDMNQHASSLLDGGNLIMSVMVAHVESKPAISQRIREDLVQPHLFLGTWLHISEQDDSE